MEDTTFDLHKSLEDRHWWFVARMRIVRGLIAKLMEDRGDDFIVDVGCGTGGTVRSLSTDYPCLGIDRSDLAIGMARKSHPDGQYICGEMPDDLSEFRDRIGLFLLMDVLEHIDDDRGFLENLVSITRPGSRILITVPAGKKLWSPHDVSAGHVRRYEAGDLNNLWAGLDVTPRIFCYFNTRLYPLIVLARYIGNRINRPWGRHGTDFSVPPAPVNWLLTKIFAGETARIVRCYDASVTEPIGAGVSLLAVLERTDGPDA